MNDTRDTVVPRGRWEFDQEVTDAFDDMLRRSIPQYDVMRESVFAFGRAFVRPGHAVVDLGCSRGEAMAPFVTAFSATSRFVGVETSEPMRQAAEARFASFGDRVRILGLDLRAGYPQDKASLVLAVLTLQFVPLEHRLRVVRDAFESLCPGGAMIVVEKVLGESAALDALFVRLHHETKVRNGYGADDVARKRASLEGVLVPVTARWNVEMLRGAGFREVDCFWRWANFAAWIAIK